MEIPLQITFRGLEGTEAIEARIREEASRLERHHGKLTACRVMVESRHRHHRKGHLFHVRIDLTAPGGEIVVSREPADEHAHEDLYVAIADAFQAARRRLEDFTQIRRGEVKGRSNRATVRAGDLGPTEGS